MSPCLMIGSLSRRTSWRKISTPSVTNLCERNSLGKGLDPLLMSEFHWQFQIALYLHTHNLKGFLTFLKENIWQQNYDICWDVFYHADGQTKRENTTISNKVQRAQRLRQTKTKNTEQCSIRREIYNLRFSKKKRKLPFSFCCIGFIIKTPSTTSTFKLSHGRLVFSPSLVVVVLLSSI